MSQSVEPVVTAPSPPPASKPPVVHSLDHVIPTRNQPALLGYYYAMFGLLPVVGLVLSPVAICYGIIGLDRGNRLPRNIGYGHALFATVAGIVGAIISYGLVIALAVVLAVHYMGNTWPFPQDPDPIDRLMERVSDLEQNAAKPERGVPGRNLH